MLEAFGGALLSTATNSSDTRPRSRLPPQTNCRSTGCLLICGESSRLEGFQCFDSRLINELFARPLTSLRPEKPSRPPFFHPSPPGLDARFVRILFCHLAVRCSSGKLCFVLFLSFVGHPPPPPPKKKHSPLFLSLSAELQC